MVVVGFLQVAALDCSVESYFRGSDLCIGEFAYSHGNIVRFCKVLHRRLKTTFST
uniref:Uncharacterized protein n=1 Tax=Manihot esculenta TaxID=3983 RepID=A0A2C9UTL9_MANES